MLARIRSIWHDPVWSKVIATAVIAAGAGAWTFRAAIASAFGAADDWLTKPRRLAVGDLLLAALVGAVAALILFRRSARAATAQNQAPLLVVEPEAPAVSGNEADYESIASWYAGFNAVEGIFTERQEYMKRSAGRRVRWQGSVFNVDVYNDGTQLSIRDGLSITNLVFVYFPATFRERVIALRVGDRVLVTGRIKDTSSYKPRIDGEQLDVVP